MRQALKLSILIVANHLLTRLGLKQVLSHDFRDVVFGDAETAEQALAQIKAKPWRLVILDASLPDDDNGFSVLREVRALRPQAAVLVLGTHPDSQSACNSVPPVTSPRPPPVPICSRRSAISRSEEHTSETPVT